MMDGKDNKSLLPPHPPPVSPSLPTSQKNLNSSHVESSSNTIKSPSIPSEINNPRSTQVSEIYDSSFRVLEDMKSST